MINKQHFEQRDQEKQKLLKEKEQLENEIKSYDFQKKIEELKNKTLNPQNQQEEKNFQEEKKENEDFVSWYDLWNGSKVIIRKYEVFNR